MKLNFLIVGQGLAGTTLAHYLLKQNQSVAMVNSSPLSHSSMVAAGIWNPVVFKRLTKSWMADELIPELKTFYQDIEKTLQTDLITEREIIKPLSEQNEIDFWKKKAESDNPFLGKEIKHDFMLSEHDSIKTYSKVYQSGNLNIPEYLTKSKAHFMKYGPYLEEELDYELLEIADSEVRYKNIQAERIVFCEGHLISRNPYFNWLPMKPAKGEVLTIKCEELKLEKDIFNKNFFIMPLGKHFYKVGATYEWNELNDLPTEKAKADLTEKLKAVLHIPFDIIHHQAGVRPSVIDRRPVMGYSKLHQHVLIFNGLGTKGVMLAPFFAQHFADFLLNEKPLYPEVDISRFDSLNKNRP